MSSFFTCPVCGKPLSGTSTLTCSQGHSFDRNKHGYINLLLSNSSSKKRHGDDQLMVLSRTQFLEKGYYAPVREAVLQAILPHAVAGMRLLDAGCGEGWYTAYIASCLQTFQPLVAGVDISRDALRQAHKRQAGMELAVASTAKLPVADASCQCVLNIFSPEETAEFHRVLAPGGILIRAVPMERHLWGLKSAVYDTPYLNPPPGVDLPGFTLLGRQDVVYDLSLPCQEDIWNLFTMTPYYYKTGREDQEKLRRLDTLEEHVEIAVLSYQKA